MPICRQGYIYHPIVCSEIWSTLKENEWRQRSIQYGDFRRRDLFWLERFAFAPLEIGHNDSSFRKGDHITDAITFQFCRRAAPTGRPIYLEHIEWPLPTSSLPTWRPHPASGILHCSGLS